MSLKHFTWAAVSLGHIEGDLPGGGGGEGTRGSTMEFTTRDSRWNPSLNLKSFGKLGKPSLKKKCNIFYIPPPYFL